MASIFQSMQCLGLKFLYTHSIMEIVHNRFHFMHPPINPFGYRKMPIKIFKTFIAPFSRSWRKFRENKWSIVGMAFQNFIANTSVSSTLGDCFHIKLVNVKIRLLHKFWRWLVWVMVMGEYFTMKQFFFSIYSFPEFFIPFNAFFSLQI